MPSTTTFDRQDREYKESVLPDGPAAHRRRSGRDDFWWKYGCAAVVGIDTFGESAPASVLFKHFGFTPENVADTVRACAAARAGRQVSDSFLFRSDRMAIKVGINGFGRIGRNVLRSAVQNFSDIEIVGINDLLEPDYLAYMLQYDSVHGRFEGKIAVDGNTLIVNGKKIRLTQEKDPANLKWGEIGAEVVIESTGIFLTKEGGQKHIAGRREEGDPVGAVEGRHADVRVRRQPPEVQGRGDHLQRLLHHQLPGAAGQGAERQVGHQARPDDHRARRHRDAEDRGRPVQQGLARRPRHPGKHHPLQHRRGQGGGRGDPRAEQEADRHVLPRADLRRVGGRPDRSNWRSRRPTPRSARR
jgi:hypothetical protein